MTEYERDPSPDEETAEQDASMLMEPTPPPQEPKPEADTEIENPYDGPVANKYASPG